MFYLGLDLGQAADYTALSVLEEPVWMPLTGWKSATELTTEQAQLMDSTVGYLWRQQAPTPTPLWLRQLIRFPLQTAYPAIVDDVISMLGGKDTRRTDVMLVVDGTGVGAPVVDMFRYAGLPCDLYNVIITGGQKKEKNHVPKRDLIGALQVSLQRKQLTIAQETLETKRLIEELQNYKVRISDAGHDSYDARSGKHDDLVLSVALAVWYRQSVYRGE